MNDAPQRRRYLSLGEKVTVIKRQNGICACHEDCEEVLEVGHINFDHRKPLWLGGTNDLSNYDALVKGHHQTKTNEEATVRAKGNRVKAKHDGTYLNKKQQALQKMLET